MLERFSVHNAGDYDAAMDYLKLAGGLVEEKKYEYLGADGFCRTKNFTTNDLIPFEVLSGIAREELFKD